jgi:hypothetical protein
MCLPADETGVYRYFVAARLGGGTIALMLREIKLLALLARNNHPVHPGMGNYFS